MLAIKFIFLVLSIFIGYTLGWYFTEKNRLADKHPLFEFEAFECRQCLSFHIAWVTSTIISLIFGDWIMAVIGIAMAFIMYFGIKIDQKHKTIKIEDPYEDVNGTYDYNIDEMKDELKNKFDIEIIDLDK